MAEAFNAGWSLIKIDENDMGICDGCMDETLVARLPIGGGGNLILCRDCWQSEMEYRHDRNNESREERDAPLRSQFPDLFDPNHPNFIGGGASDALKDMLRGLGAMDEPEPLFDLVPWPHGTDEMDLEGME